MPSKKPLIAVRTTDILLKKFNYISEKNNRSMSNQAETLIKDFIDQYELENGVILVDE